MQRLINFGTELIILFSPLISNFIISIIQYRRVRFFDLTEFFHYKEDFPFTVPHSVLLFFNFYPK